MKFAICNETFVDWPLEKALDFASEIGYTGIEFAPFTLASTIREVSAKRRSEIRSMTQRAGLKSLGLHWLLAKTQGFHLTSPDRAIRDKTAEYLRDLARCCRDLDGHLLIFGSPMQRNLGEGVTKEMGMQFAAEVFQSIVPTLEECGVTLGIEPLSPADGNFLLTADEGVLLMNMIGSPQCRLHLDCKAMSTESKPIPEIIKKHSASLVHFHVNDPNLQGPGFGTLDFVPILKALQDVGYDGWVSVEVFDYSPGPERLAKESIDYLERCLGEISGHAVQQR